MTEHEELDERMRRRLSGLGDVAPHLDAAARARVVAQALAAHRRTTWLRRAAVASAGVMAAAAVWAWMAVPPAPRCAGWDPVALEDELGAGVTSLGARGLVGLSSDGAAAIVRREACLTEIALTSGRVAVRADDLGGGELSVRAGATTVRVTGTRFAVAAGERVEVAVSEGTVEVRTERETTRLSAGHALTVGGPARAIDGWAERIDALLSGSEVPDAEVEAETAPEAETIVAVEPATPETEPAVEHTGAPAVDHAGESEAPFDADAAALAAEGAWRRGDRDAARELFRRAAPVSEAACLRWARLELEAGALDRAETALQIHRRRHARGRMGAEAAYLGLELLEARHDEAGARAAAESIVARYPGTPQASAAARRLR